MRIRSALAAVAFAALTVPGAPATAQDGGLYDQMQARHIGPAGMSGRVSAVDVVLSDRNQIYVASATGGVHKSEDGGLTWNPVFDDEHTLGMGAVAVFQPNPDIVWAGTGEGNPRNSAGVGRGIWKSIDAGRTWRWMGLEESERIHRIVPHPTDPDVVYVGAMGPAWSDGRQRGVYKTTDGGETWERVLWVDERTGIADLIMDPSNPDKLFAAMWEFRRTPSFFTSGGPGSGLYVTHDGGRNWSELTEDDGLPPGDLGRIGLAISPSDPEVVYALVEAERSELLRSDDGGASWRTISDREGVAPRPFYYADLRIDPKNENRIYSLHSAIQVSEDQGRTWRTVVPSAIIHGDVHELWIDPDDPRKMIIGEDGGIAFTYDRGDHWRFVENLTLAQFYEIEVDMDTPYNVYGGLQDNGSWYGPSTVWETKGILNAHWRRVGGGDGFDVMDDPSSDRHGYSMSQQGNLQRFDKVTGTRVGIRPVHPDGVPLRFNWNAALSLDPHDSTTIYMGSQFVHRSADHGDTWEILSPDLTTNDPAHQRQDVSGGLSLDATGAENNTTILTIQVSHLDPELIWVGTDDGRVHVTRDGGATWTSVEDNIPGAPGRAYVPDVQPSKHDAGTAYVVMGDHRNGDWTPYVFRTRDYGATWADLATDDIDGFVRAIEEDPVEPDLLFLGTEFGLHVSLNGGVSWEKFTAGVPAVPIRDLLVHPREHDLVLGTHGRGVIIVDDIRPLRARADGSVAAGAGPVMIDPPPAHLLEIAEGIGYRSTGHAMQQAETRPFGALLSFWHNDREQATVTVRTDGGDMVWQDEIDAVPGVNRFEWNLRPGDDADEDVFPGFLEVMPGRYEVTVAAGGASSSADLDVRLDPRGTVTVAQLQARREAVAQIASWNRTAQEARDRMDATLEALGAVLRTLDADDADLRTRGRALQDTVQARMQAWFTGPECQGICGGDPLVDAVRAPLGRVAGRMGAPTPTDRTAMAQAQAALDELVTGVNALFADHVQPYRQALQAAGYSPLPNPDPLRSGN
ncbi:MAG: hypothetical protein RJQ04_01805 [Longimicrobiales bacterium]